MTDQPTEDVTPEFEVYQPKFVKLDLASSTEEITLIVKTWGEAFANRPRVLVLTKDTASDLLKRLQKAVDGLV